MPKIPFFHMEEKAEHKAVGSNCIQLLPDPFEMVPKLCKFITNSFQFSNKLQLIPPKHTQATKPKLKAIPEIKCKYTSPQKQFPVQTKLIYEIYNITYCHCNKKSQESVNVLIFKTFLFCYSHCR